MQGNQRLGVISGAGNVRDTLRTPRPRSARPGEAPRPLPQRPGRGRLCRGSRQPGGTEGAPLSPTSQPSQRLRREGTRSLPEPAAGSPRPNSGVSPHPASSPGTPHPAPGAPSSQPISPHTNLPASVGPPCTHFQPRGAPLVLLGLCCLKTQHRQGFNLNSCL